jgi:hypothetical protein
VGGATHTGGQDEGLCGVHSNGADVVWVCLERCDLLRCVVVVYAQLEVIGTYIQAASGLAFVQAKGVDAHLQLSNSSSR